MCHFELCIFSSFISYYGQCGDRTGIGLGSAFAVLPTLRDCEEAVSRKQIESSIDGLTRTRSAIGGMEVEATEIL